ncbi:winged helix-turn-helix domain-containing protein [Natribaculum luteum]|uniref:Winged helix-turn-helix domain-containing protein n=1 Tax=Natribaculum luteum TaxID=1586232 RepID=A0ABD5P6H7_9EURY|nr:MarR family winged helix-turn-helix transcriptional regulator [Natribaculum luteum]
MSKTSQKTTIKRDRSSIPRAIVHKQILDAAEKRPDASVEEIAVAVSGASPDLVQQVFEEYGDPAADDVPPDAPTPDEEESDGEETDAGPMTDEPSPADADHSQRGIDEDIQLNDKQRQTLRAIYETPEATQRDLGERFDVTGATINKRVNSIDGFDWETREEFVTSLFETENGESMQQEQSTEFTAEQHSIDELQERVTELTETVRTLESQLEDVSDPSRESIEDPELVQKIVHACFRSDQISDDEELQIIEMVLSNDR